MDIIALAADVGTAQVSTQWKRHAGGSEPSAEDRGSLPLGNPAKPRGRRSRTSRVGRRLLLMGAVSALLVLAFTPEFAPAQGTAADQLSVDAKELIDSKLPRAAVVVLDRGLEAFPENGELKALKSTATAQVALAEAKAIIAEALIETDPARASKLATAALSIDKENALAEAVLLSAGSPAPAEEWHENASMLIAEKLPQRASELLDRALAEFPTNGRLKALKRDAEAQVGSAEVSAIRAEALIETDPEGASELATAALNIDKENAVAKAVLLAAGPTALAARWYDEARTLIDEELPQRAIELLDRALAAFPASERLAELKSEAAAKVLLADAIATRAKALMETDSARASELATDALEIDRENAVAQGVLSSAAWVQGLKARWDRFFEDVLGPLQDLALPFLLVLVVLLVLARMLVPTAPPKWYERRWLPTGGWKRPLLWVLGLTLALGASALLTLGVASRDGRYAAILGVVMGMSAVLLIASAMATRLRLNIEVRRESGAVDEAAVGQVIALLAELGAAKPAGLEVPRGADVTELEGTRIAGTPANKVIAAFVSLWGLIFGTTPWRVRVDAQSADRHSVVVTRNGHGIASAVVDRDQLHLRSPIVEAAHGPTEGKDGDLPDLYRFSAALVLTTLAQRYKGFEGLLRVTDWRSLGLQNVATLDYVGPANADACRAALAQAVDYDAENVPAMVALRHAQDRDSQRPEVLADYCNWLVTVGEGLMPENVKEIRGEHDYAYALRLRVRKTLLATACNLRALEADKVPQPIDEIPVEQGVLQAANALMEDLKGKRGSKAKPWVDAEALRKAMRPSVAVAYLSLGTVGHRPDAVGAGCRRPGSAPKVTTTSGVSSRGSTPTSMRIHLPQRRPTHRRRSSTSGWHRQSRASRSGCPPIHGSRSCVRSRSTERSSTTRRGAASSAWSSWKSTPKPCAGLD